MNREPNQAMMFRWLSGTLAALLMGVGVHAQTLVSEQELLGQARRWI
jgi:hypothetical protein